MIYLSGRHARRLPIFSSQFLNFEKYSDGLFTIPEFERSFTTSRH